MKYFCLIHLAAFFMIPAANAQNTAVPLPYQDEKIACLDANVANKYIQDFSIDVASFGGKELCDWRIDTKKLLNDIDILANGQFVSSSVPNNLVHGFVAANNYYAWMKEQTYGVQRGDDVPYATAYNSGGYFTMQDGWAKSSTLGRVGTFIHEARHTEGYWHVSCNQGPYKGSGLPGCDSNYSYGGSHAVEMEYYARVATAGINFHPVYQKMARLMAMARSNFVFNSSPLRTREALLALGNSRTEAFLYDQGVWVSREVPGVAGKLKRTSFGGVIFKDAAAYVIEPYKNSGFSDLVVDTYSYFKLLLDTNQSVKDFAEFDLGTRRHVVQITNDNKISAFDFPKGNWRPGLPLPFEVTKVSTAIPGQTTAGLFLINAKNEIYSYQPETQRLISQTGSWDNENETVVVFKGQNYILKTNGQIYVQSQNSLQAWPAPYLFSELVAIPVYDAFEVVK